MSTVESDIPTENVPPVDAAPTEEGEALAGVEADASEDESSDREVEASAHEDAQAADPNVYDSEARQRIPVTLMLDSGRYEIALACEPLRDETLVNYARLCEAANASESAEDEDEGATQLAALANASGWLFSVLMTDVEGIGEEGEEKPADWREIFGPRERQAILNSAVFDIEAVSPPEAKKGARPSWGSHLRSVITRLRVPFNGRTVEVSHTLRKADAAQLGAFLSLYRTAFGMGRAGDAHMAQFAAGYDALHVAHANYKGPVPMHHKGAAYISHMTRQGAAVRKN